MATTLVNRRMHPDLAARIERSLRRSSTSVGRGIYRHNTIAAFRVALAVLVVAGVTLGLVRWHRDRVALEAMRSALLATVASESSSLTARQREMAATALALVRRSAGSYEGDFVSPDLARLGWNAVLSKPIVFMRGPTADLVRSGPREPSMRGLEVVGDAFLACLLDPPKAREDTEAALVVRFRDQGAPPSRAVEVPLLKDAEAGLPALSAEFEGRVRGARSVRELAHLRNEFERAPVAAAERAAKASVLIAVLDEPDEGTGFAEFEGELAHYARTVIFDLDASSVLLRVRTRVDPSWIQKSRRPRYARDLDGCKLAMGVRDQLSR